MAGHDKIARLFRVAGRLPELKGQSYKVFKSLCVVIHTTHRAEKVLLHFPLQKEKGILQCSQGGRQTYISWQVTTLPKRKLHGKVKYCWIWLLPKAPREADYSVLGQHWLLAGSFEKAESETAPLLYLPRAMVLFSKQALSTVTSAAQLLPLFICWSCNGAISCSVVFTSHLKSHPGGCDFLHPKCIHFPSTKEEKGTLTE